MQVGQSGQYFSHAGTGAHAALITGVDANNLPSVTAMINGTWTADNHIAYVDVGGTPPVSGAYSQAI